MTVQKVIVFLGAPGSGKGTQSQRLSSYLSYPTFSTGQILRSEIASNSELGKRVKDIIDSGRLVSDEIMNELIVSMLNASDNPGIILDGYPRTKPQAEFFDNYINVKNIKLNVINLYVAEENLIQRFTGRFSCAGCGAIYNKVFSNPKIADTCDVCGGHEFIKRVDDSYEAVITRLKVYEENTKPLLDYYRNSANIVEVDGEKPIEDITNQLITSLTK